MSDTVSRFSGRQGDYLAGRPPYPAELLEWLGALYAPPGRSAAADVGSGTGKLTAQLLRAGFRVYGVEPNGDMRRRRRPCWRAIPASPPWTARTGTWDLRTGLWTWSPRPRPSTGSTDPPLPGSAAGSCGPADGCS